MTATGTRSRHAGAAAGRLAAGGLLVLIAAAPAQGAHPPQAAVRSTPAACAALANASIAAVRLGEPSGGAIVTSAVHRDAASDRALPDYCEVLVDIRPQDPAAPPVKVQVNLPARWNGKSLQFGGAGYNGVLQTGTGPSRNAGPQVPLPLTQGYVTSGTDSGHQSPRNGEDYAWALNDEAVRNFAYAAYKNTHDVTRELSRRYYGRIAWKSYYMGGSEGGREAMTMAQRYPADYDGIIAIDPVMNWSGLQTFGNRTGGILQSGAGAWLGGKWRLLAATVTAACDVRDGLADSIVSDVSRCAPLAEAALATHRCPSGSDEGAGCFSDAQLEAIRAAHAGYRFPFALANGVTSYAGYAYGGEGLAGNWVRWVNGDEAPTANADAAGNSQTYRYGSVYVRYFIARDPAFNALAYDPARFRDRVLQVSRIMDATNPDLGAFHARGGKLILREDMADKAQSPLTGLQYRDAVVGRMGRATVDRFFAAFVATGLPHTSGGVDAGAANAPSYGIPGRVDLLAILDDWVVKGVAPGRQLVLTQHDPLPPYAITASRLACRHGSWPKFVGTGGADGRDATQFACVDP